MKIKAIGAALALVGIGAVSMNTAQAQAGVFKDRVPGSALVYPLFDVNNDAGNARATTFKLSNLGNEKVWVHFVRVCGGIKSYGGQGLCQASDRQIELTAKETIVRDVRAFFSLNRDTCPTGFIVAYAQVSQNDKQPKVYNNLIGSLHYNSFGNLNQRTSGMQALAFQAEGAQNTAVAGSSPGPQPALPFNGTTGYTSPAKVYWTDYLATAGTRFSELTLLTLDTTAGFQNDPTYVALDAWNQDEESFSGGIEYVCHVRVRLDDEVNLAQPGAGVQGGAAFGTQGGLGSAYGLLRMESLTPQHAILGAIMEQGQNRQTMRGLFHDETIAPTTFFGR
jgi:hypothetical protein